MAMLSYLRARTRAGLALLVSAAVFAAVFALYRLPWQAALYAGALCLMALFALSVPDYLKYREKHALLTALKREAFVPPERLPAPADPLEADYQALIRALNGESAARLSEAAARFDGMTDYYTLWAHQIKTPIAAMRLLLQEEGPDPRELADELFKIEQYVEMALCYLRLGSESTDYVLRPADLDEVIKQALRKYAPQFIRRKIVLDYEPLGVQALTDEKWLSFVVEQVLSNALKYAPGGRISIRLEPPMTLVISDTGIGIAPEDLPRVFEKGYTGLNGRYDKRATGIGLYLCKRIMKNLGHGISIASEVGKGTAVRLELDVKPLEVE
jgi:signal transduction histidine kinase